MNMSVDTHFYPLGSCTMKYNPKRNERLASLPGWLDVHPYQPESTLQGYLQLLFELQQYLAEISGLPGVSLQPAAGAHGELTALMVAAAHFRELGETRSVVLTPDSAHGTNPASASMAGFDTVTIPSAANGFVDLAALRDKLDQRVAVFMITNPNTLGLFDAQVAEIAELVHAQGGLIYLDGANMNAILGITRPGDFGADLMHFNPHKTFSGPHGGGGPVPDRSASPRNWSRTCPPRSSTRMDSGSIWTTTVRCRSVGCGRSSATSASCCGRTATSARTARTACGKCRKTPFSMPTTC